MVDSCSSAVLLDDDEWRKVHQKFHFSPAVLLVLLSRVSSPSSHAHLVVVDGIIILLIINIIFVSLVVYQRAAEAAALVAH